MKRIVAAVLLSFLGPGLGQFYNRDHKKGTIILVLSIILFFAYIGMLFVKVIPHLPAEQMNSITPEMVQSAVTLVKQKDRHVLSLVFFAFLGLWAYAISEAYFKAKEMSANEESPDEKN